MTGNRNNPALDPADNDTLVGSIRFAFQKLIQQTEGMLPAQVIRYDRAENRVEVQILISIVGTDGTIYPRPQIASIPVLVLGGGGFFISAPLETGNLGWILANDRDISNFLQQYAQVPPNTTRIKQFSDGLFIPDVMKDFTVTGGNANKNLIISSVDGAVRIELVNTTLLKQLQIWAPNGVTVNGVPLTVP